MKPTAGRKRSPNHRKRLFTQVRASITDNELYLQARRRLSFSTDRERVLEP